MRNQSSVPYDHVYVAAAILSLLIGIALGMIEGWSTAWGWFSAAVPYFILARNA